MDAYDQLRARALARLRGEPEPVALAADEITAAVARIKAEQAAEREVRAMIRAARKSRGGIVPGERRAEGER